MAKKSAKKASKAPRTYTVHKRLEEPVHNLVGWLVLLMFSVAILFVAMNFLQ